MKAQRTDIEPLTFKNLRFEIAEIYEGSRWNYTCVADFANPAWSPDGLWIYYIYEDSDRSQLLVSCQPDGSQKVVLLEYDYH